MTALELPAPDAPAEEWGRLAVSIPGWRWPAGMHWSGPGFTASSTGSSPTNNVRQFVRVGFMAVYPDPDHWAWEGWLVRMLGLSMPDWWVSTTVLEDGTPHEVFTPRPRGLRSDI